LTLNLTRIAIAYLILPLLPDGETFFRKIYGKRRRQFPVAAQTYKGGSP
jgi:hypothetical protein